MRRFELSDEQWLRVEGLLPEKSGDPGQPGKDNRLFLDAVLWIVRTGAPWRDLPERIGDWNSTFVRFNRWAKKGVWLRVFDALQAPLLSPVENGGASRGKTRLKMAARGIEGLSGLAPGEPGNGIG